MPNDVSDWLGGLLGKPVAPPHGAAPGPTDGAQPSDNKPSPLKDPLFKALVEAMEADVAEAQKQWSSQINDSVFTLMDPALHAEYNSDWTDCDSSQKEFNAEWNKIVIGGGDPAKLLAVCDIFAKRVRALQVSNARIEALIDIDVGQRFAAIFTVLFNISKLAHAKRINTLIATLTDKLSKAQTAVTKAEVKAGLNALVSLVTLIVVPEEAVAKAAYSLGAIVVHIVIDHGLGEGSTAGTIVFVAGDGADVVALSEEGGKAVEKLGEAGKKTFGGTAAVVTAILDVKEVYEGKEIVERILKDIETLHKAYDDLMAGVYPLVSELSMLEKGIAAIKTEMAAAMVRVNSAAKDYQQIKDEIAKAVQAGS